jgi:hypothetical protein
MVLMRMGDLCAQTIRMLDRAGLRTYIALMRKELTAAEVRHAFAAHCHSLRFRSLWTCVHVRCVCL